MSVSRLEFHTTGCKDLIKGTRKHFTDPFYAPLTGEIFGLNFYRPTKASLASDIGSHKECFQ